MSLLAYLSFAFTKLTFKLFFLFKAERERIDRQTEAINKKTIAIKGRKQVMSRVANEINTTSGATSTKVSTRPPSRGGRSSLFNVKSKEAPDVNTSHSKDEICKLPLPRRRPSSARPSSASNRMERTVAKKLSFPETRHYNPLQLNRTSSDDLTSTTSECSDVVVVEVGGGAWG